MIELQLTGTGVGTVTPPKPIGWQEIPGNSVSIESIYVPFLETCEDGDIIVELGVFAGRSLAMLSQMAKEMGKRPRIFGVDLWEAAGDITRRGNEGKNPYEPCTFKTCEEWLRKADVLDNVMLVIRDTAACAQLFQDSTCKLVYVDADHSHMGVKRDIEAWRSKVMGGGVLAGHDFCAEYSGVPAAVMEAFPEFVHHGKEFGNTGISWAVRM